MPDKWAQYAVKDSASSGDKWAQYAEQPQPQAAPSKPADSVRATPSFSEQVGSMLRHPINSLRAAADPVSRPANASLGEMAGADLHNVAAGASSVFAHPLNTIGGALASIGGVLTAPFESAAGKQNEFQQIYNEANTNGPQFGATTLGQSLGTAAVAPLAGKPLEMVGEHMQDTGAGVINHTVGSLQKDFKRGADPGRAYLEAGGGPAMSMDSLAGKARALKQDVGQQLGNAYDNATASGVKIPVQKVTSALRGPIQNARNVIAGPGGTGDLNPVRQFGASFRPPIQDALNNGGFTPNDLFGVKKNVAQNTSWGDPTQVGMKSLRQQTTGALGDALTDSVPEAKPLNAQYQGLTNMANRATLRAQTGSSPLTGIARKTALGAGGAAIGMSHSPLAGAAFGIAGTMLDSVPVKTTLGSGLYGMGGGLVQIGSRLKGLYGP